MGKRKPRKYIHTVSRNVQKYLKRNAEILAENPEKILPVCTEECKSCPFKKIERRLRQVSELRDDEKKLMKIAMRDKDLVMAYAGFLTVRFQESLPVLSAAHTQDGMINFVRKSKASKEVEIGVQHFDNPSHKIFAYINYARKNYHFYIGKDDVYCSGKLLKPPEQFMEYLSAELPYKISRNRDGYSCGHYGYGLEIKMGIESIFVCEKCVKSDFNLFHFLSRKILAKNLAKEIEIYLFPKFRCDGDCGEKCPMEPISSKNMVTNYISGKMSDSQFLKEMKNIHFATMQKSGRILILGETCFGENIEKFADALTEDNETKEILLKFLKRWNKPLMAEDKSLNKVLSVMWKEIGREVLSEIYGEDIAEKYYKHDNPIEALSMIKREHALKKISSRIPEIDNLPPIAKFVDYVVRIARALGTEEAVRAVESANKDSREMKIASYAFLKIFSSAEKHRWRYSKEEMEAAEIVENYLRRLLQSEGEEYTKTLRELATILGAGKGF